MQLQCENLNLELISEDVEPYNNNLRHSIVWYLKNAAKITDNVVEIGNNPFSTIDEDTSNPILSFDSTETKLARIISICNSFKAEFQFKTNLKDDGTLQNITLDLYQTGGVGQLRKDVTLYYGKNIDGITSTGDRTSTFFNSTTVTDSNNKYNWLSIEGKYYNSDGQLEFYKDAGSNTAYAPLSRDMFPSQILSTSSDQYTNKNIQTSASSNDDLWDYAVSQFKLYAYPQMTYEVVVSVNAVTSALGNDKKLNIGDTIIVQDSTFDKSDGGLILSARVSEQEISFTNPLNNKITFTNFVKLKSEISADLYGRMKDLVDQNTPYKAEVETTNGLQFKNGKGSTTLTARIYFGSDSTETKADSYEWRKDGTLVANVQEITVDASEIDGKAVYAYKATVNEKVVGTASVTITNVNDGERGPQGLKGDPGATGIPGQPGADGKTSYLHIAYATNSTGTAGFDVSNATGKTYIGQYTDFTSADSTDPSKYTWSLIKGDKGDKGDPGNNGTNGIAGNDGKGIKATAITYQASTNGTTAPTGTWSASVPTVAKGSFLWTRTIWTYTDNTTETGYAVAYMGTNGNNGNDGIAGKDGTGIKNTTITYAGSTSGTTAPTSGWTSTVPTVAAGSYLWTKTVWAYTDNTSETGYSVGKMGNTGPAGSDGNPGKVVSDTEPTTKFKGLTWKYSGVVDMTLGDGTKILAGTEYYWNGTVWALYEINAHNINGDNLSVTNGTFKDGKIESIWGGNGVNGTTTIEGSHLQIYSSDSTTNTENTIALDNLQGYAQVYTDHNTGRTITVQASFQGFFVSDSTGPYVSVTPTGIVNSVDVSWTTIGSYAAYRRDGRVVTIRVVGAKRSTTGDIYIGTIPLKHCPAASVMGSALAWSAGVANDKHIQINGLNQSNSGTVTILSAVANQEYTFQLTYQI
ncbi:collagen-like protein [Lactococcus cremoris subsp. cremoris]|nr:collagen-like protein [Lactococcus cremoris]